MFHQNQGTIFGPASQTGSSTAAGGIDTQNISIPLSKYTELVQAVEKGKWTEKSLRSDTSVKEMQMKADYSKYIRVTKNLLQQLQKISQTAFNPSQFYTQNLLEAGISLAEAEKMGADQVSLDNWVYVSDHFQEILDKSQSADSEYRVCQEKLDKANVRLAELEKLLSATKIQPSTT